MCTFGLLSCETPAETKRANMGRDREKSAKIWATHPLGPHPLGPRTPFGAPPFGAPPLGAPQFGAPPFRAPPFGARFFLGLGPTLWGHDTHQIQKWIGQNWFDQNWFVQIGQIRTCPSAGPPASEAPACPSAHHHSLANTSFFLNMLFF